jgi:glutaredoxin
MLRRLFSRARARSGPAKPVPVVLYERRDCPLCDEMEEALAGARLDAPYALVRLDVDADEPLRARFDRSVPVLAIGGRVAFKGRLERADLERKFARLARAWRAAGQPDVDPRSPR